MMLNKNSYIGGLNYSMKNIKTLKLVQLAILVALLFILAFTPLGYLRFAAISITFMMLPVVLGSVLLGPTYGAILGFFFGLTSFLQCFGIDPFGTALFSLSPLLTACLCFIPRILMGWISGLIFKGLNKLNNKSILSFAVASISGALLNTILFVGMLIICFGNNEALYSILSLSENSIWLLITTFITINAIVEAAACLLIGTPLTKVLYKYRAENLAANNK